MKTCLAKFMQLFALTLLLVAVGCAPKPKQAKTTINITPSMAIANINMNGGALVYGQKTDGAGSWGKVFRPGENVVVDMSFGSWNFSVFAYDGSNGELTGAIECSTLNGVNIGEEQEVVEMKIDLAQCAGAGIRRVDLQLCTGAEFSSADPVANCSQSATGIRSWRMRMHGHRGNTPNGEFLRGPCIVEANYTGGSLDRRFPSGLGNISTMPAVFEAYTSTDCSGSATIIPFDNSLSASSAASLKTFENGNILNMVANLQGAGVDTTAPAVTIASDNAHVDGSSNRWINSANETAFNLTGTCETGINVEFILDGTLLRTITCAGAAYNENFDLSGETDFGLGSSQTFEVRQTDLASNVGSATQAYAKDTLAPTGASPGAFTEGTYSNATTINASFGLGSDATSGVNEATVTYYNFGTCGTAEGTVSTVTTGSDTFTGTDGTTYSYQIDVADNAGNTTGASTCSSTTTIDTTAPNNATTLAWTPSNPTNDNTPQISWTISTSLDVLSQDVLLYNNSACGALQSSFSKTALANNHTFSALADGTYSFRIRTTDLSGQINESPCSANIIIDTQAPTGASSIAFTNSNPTNSPQLNVNFIAGTDSSGILNYTVNFYDDSGCSNLKDSGITVGITYATTALSAAMDGTDDGTYYVQIVTQDNASNTTMSTCVTGVTRDTIAPATPILDSTTTGNDWNKSSPTASKNVGTSTFSVDGTTDFIDISLWDGVACSGNQIDSVTGLANSTNDYSWNFTTAGPRYYEIIARDNAGNTASSCSALLDITQPAMGVGGEYLDGFVVGNTHLFALNNGGLESFNVSALHPATIDLQGVTKIPGFEPDSAGYDNNSIYIYRDGSADLYVYTTTGAGSLNQPAYVGVMNTGETDMQEHTFSAGYMWVINTSNQLRGIDISTPGTTGTNIGPVALGQSGCTGITYESTQDHLFISCGEIIVPVDISTPASPVVLTGVDPDGTTTVYEALVAGEANIIYAVGDGGGTQFSQIDISTPASPSVTKVRATTGSVPLTSISNFNAASSYVAGCSNDAPDQAIAFDTIPGAMPPRGNVESISTQAACNVTLLNDNEVFNLSSGGITRTDAAGGGAQTDTNPYLPGFTYSVAVHNGSLWAAETRGAQGWTLFDLADPGNPKVALQDYTQTSYNIVAFGNDVFIPSGTVLKRYTIGTGPLSVTPQTDIALSRGVNNTTGLTFASGVGTAGVGMMYVGHTDGYMSVVDLNNMTKLDDPQVCSASVAVVDITVEKGSKDKVFALCSDGEVRGFDNSNPNVSFASITGAPGNWTLPSNGENYDALEATGTTLYVSNNNNGTQVYDVSSLPTPPGSATTNLAGNTANDLTLIGNVLYVSIGQGGLRSWNITSPLSPALLDAITVPGTPGHKNAVAPLDSSPTPQALYQTTYRDGLQVINVEDPSNMHQ